MDHRENVYYEDEIVFELHSDLWVVLFQIQKNGKYILKQEKCKVKYISMQENMMFKTGRTQ